MKHSTEFNAFDKLVGRVLTVPHSVIENRVKEHRKQVDANPKRRGPKRKAKPSASDRDSNDQT